MTCTVDSSSSQLLLSYSSPAQRLVGDDC